MRKGWMIAAAVAGVAVWAAAQSPATQPASAQPAATQPDADRIAALVAKMGDPKFPVRQQAQKELVRLGAPAEPALRVAAAHSPSAEIRSRATAALDTIEDNLPDAPTRVSVRVANADPRTALRSLAEQAGVAIIPENRDIWTYDNRRVSPITLDLDRVPLLVALEKFCKATHTRPEANSGWLSISYGGSGVWDQEDRAAVVANFIEHDRGIDLSNSAGSRQDEVELLFFLDPRRPLVDYRHPAITVAVDENGVSLAATRKEIAELNGPNGNGFTGAYNLSRWGFDAWVPLHFPPHFGKRLARLEGTVTLRVATNVEPLNIPDLAKSVGTTTIAGDREVEVLSFDGATGSLHLRISTVAHGMLNRLRGTPGDASTNLYGEFVSATAVDANGMAVGFKDDVASGSNRQLDWHGTLTARAPVPLKGPFSLRWNVISQTTDIVVPFKFKNVPLPPE